MMKVNLYVLITILLVAILLMTPNGSAVDIGRGGIIKPSTEFTAVQEIKPDPIIEPIFDPYPIVYYYYNSTYLYHNPISSTSVPLTTNNWTGDMFEIYNETTGHYYMKEGNLLRNTNIHRTMLFSFTIRSTEDVPGTYDRMYIKPYAFDYAYPYLDLYQSTSLVGFDYLLIQVKESGTGNVTISNDTFISPGENHTYGLWYLNDGYNLTTRLYIDDNLAGEYVSSYANLTQDINSPRIKIEVPVSSVWYVLDIYWAEMPHVHFSEEFPLSIKYGEHHYPFTLRRGVIGGDFTIEWNASLVLPNGTAFYWTNYYGSPQHYIEYFDILRYMYAYNVIEATVPFTEESGWFIRFDLKNTTPPGSVFSLRLWVIDADRGMYDASFMGQPEKSAVPEEAPLKISWSWIAGGAGIAIIAIVAVAYGSVKKQCDDKDYAKGHPKICKIEKERKK